MPGYSRVCSARIKNNNKKKKITKKKIETKFTKKKQMNTKSLHIHIYDVDYLFNSQQQIRASKLVANADEYSF